MKKSYKISALIQENLPLIILGAGLMIYAINTKSCAEHKNLEGLEKKIEKSSQSANSYKIDEEIFYRYLESMMQKRD